MGRKEYQIQRWIGGEWRTIYTNRSKEKTVDEFTEEMKYKGKKRCLALTIETQVIGLKLK